MNSADLGLCPLQLEEQLSAQQTLEEEHATVKEALDSAESGIKNLTSQCTSLEAELAKLDQVSLLACGHV